MVVLAVLRRMHNTPSKGLVLATRDLQLTTRPQDLLARA